MAFSQLLGHLNPAQRQAATARDGYLCINAAAGTGKTSTVAARILYLQDQGVPPGAITAVSFSRAARANLIQRLEEFIGLWGKGSMVTILTFHGLAYRILRLAMQHGETWLLPGFEVVTGGRSAPNTLFEQNAEALLAGVRDEYQPDVRAELYARALDLVRQGHCELNQPVIEPVELDDVREAWIHVPSGHGAQTPASLGMLQKVWKRYERLMHRKNVIDYPGMLTESLNVLSSEGYTLGELQRGLRYLIVDEYQDTSRAQEELLRLLAGHEASVNVVGDSDQAIYTFNGSDVENIRQFDTRLAEQAWRLLPPVNLTWNYRSTPNILAAANRVLAHISDSCKRLELAPTGVSSTVEEYRCNNPPVVRVLAWNIKDAAKWVAQETSRLTTEERVQPADIAVLVRKDTEYSPQGAAVRQALNALGLETVVQDRDPQRTLQVAGVVRDFLNQQIGAPLEDLIPLVQAHEFDADLVGVTIDEALAVLEEARLAGAADALEAADLVFEKGSPEQTPPDISGIQVRTIHSAKGLEFRVVFLMYVGDREFPSGAWPDVEEEHRLYYVGITRAMERLYVLGRPGAHDFFGEIEGEGVQLVHAVPPDDVRTTDDVGADTVRQIEAARRNQKDEEARRRARR
ncbi:MAG: ATP-dependent helicase [Symbiobacteriia bacterium]